MPLYSRKGYRQLWALQKAKQNTHTSIKKIKANVGRASFQKYSVRNVNMYCVLTLGINSKCFILAMLSDTKHSLFLLYFEFIFWFSQKGMEGCSGGSRGHCYILLHGSCSFPKYVISGQLLPFSSSTFCNLTVAMFSFLFFFLTVVMFSFFLTVAMFSWPSISKSTFFLFLNCSLIPFPSCHLTEF